MMTMRHDPIDPSEFAGTEHPAFPALPARVADRMTRPAVTISWDESVAYASRLMEEHRIRHLPVIDADQHLIGIVTDGDLAGALATQGVWDASTAPPTFTVGKAMTWKAVAVTPSCGLAEAVKLMYECKLSALPVVEDDRVVGILSEIDVLREFAKAIEGG